MRSYKQSAVLAIVSISLTACVSAFFYSGDGNFTDNGILAYSRRYVIDLGPIDLSTTGTRRFRLSGLPHAQFNVAIHVQEAKQNELNIRPSYPATVRMQLINEGGEIVIDEKSALDTWVRGHGLLDNISELYLSGASKEIVLGKNLTRDEPVGLKASGGWGTYFKSERATSYNLTVEVLDTKMKQPARVVVVGWDRT